MTAGKEKLCCFSFIFYPEKSGKPEERIEIGSISGTDIRDVAYDLLCSAKQELEDMYHCDVKAEYEMPSVYFSPDEGIDYSISATTYADCSAGASSSRFPELIGIT